MHQLPFLFNLAKPLQRTYTHWSYGYTVVNDSDLLRISDTMVFVTPHKLGFIANRNHCALYGVWVFALDLGNCR